MNIKKLFSLIFSIVLICSAMYIPVEAASSYASHNYVEVFDGGVVQDEFTVKKTSAYYRITATETKYYNFSFDNQSVEMRTGISIADKFLNLFLGKINIQITDEYDLMLSDFNVRCGYSGNISLKLTKDKTYYIKVQSNVDGFYRMKIRSITDIGGDTWNTATETLSVGQLISSIDASGDKDWFYFETDDSDSFYSFSLENISGSSTMKMYVYEYVEGAGEIPLRDTFNISASHSNTSYKQIKLKPNSKYYFCIYLSSGIGGYQLDIEQTLDAVGDTMDDAFKVETDTKVTTALDGEGDVDYFKFTTKNYDAYYYFDLENLSIDGTYALYVYDAAGNQIGYDSEYGSCGIHINFKLDPNTEYYFKIYAYYGAATGNYKAKVTSQKDNYPDTQKEAKKISLNEEISEAINGATDVDFFKFTTKSFEAYYYFDMENLSIEGTYALYVYDAAGNQIGYDSEYGSRGIHINFKLDPNTEYYFKIYAYYGAATGNYKVTVSCIADAEGDTKDKAAAISINNPLTRQLSSNNDVDWFKLTLNYDANLRFVLTNESGDSKYIYVYSAIEKQLVYEYSSNCAQVSKILNAGEYYIKIKGNKGYYTVAVGNCGSAHNEGYRYIQATTKSDGIKTTYCKSCKTVIKKEVIPRISKISLSYTTTAYSGNVKKPSVTAVDINGDTISSKNYSVSYSGGRTNIGTYYVTVKFKGAYSGERKLSFKIVPASSSNLKIKLSSTLYSYNGKAKTPSVTVKTSKGKTLVKNRDYTVSYQSGRKNVGKYKVVVKFKGNYKGTKNLYFTIKPKATKITKLTALKNGLKVNYSKVTSQISGYQVQFSTSRYFYYPITKTVSGYNKTSYTYKGLYSSYYPYYVRVRTYKTVNGVKYYSAWSSYKSKYVKR